MRRTYEVWGQAKVTINIDLDEFEGADRDEIRRHVIEAIYDADPEIDWFREEVEGTVDEILGD